jgi:O-methyltransferase
MTKLGTAVEFLGHVSGDARLVTKGALLRRKYRGFTQLGVTSYAGNISLLANVKNVPGSIVECGVWRGGMIAGMADVLGPTRKYFLFDSFEGMPPAQEIDGDKAISWQQRPDSDNNRAEIDFAKRAMALSKATDVTYCPGWFSDTLTGFEAPGGIAVLRLDADWYESTMQCLDALYPQVVPGGLILIDDYYMFDGCSKAVHEYLAREQSLDRLRTHHRVAYMLKGNYDFRGYA